MYLCVDSVVVGCGRVCRGDLIKQHEVACNNTKLHAAIRCCMQRVLVAMHTNTGPKKWAKNAGFLHVAKMPQREIEMQRVLTCAFVLPSRPRLVRRSWQVVPAKRRHHSLR